MNSRIVLLFLLVSLTLSVNALANNGKSYIVTDENTSSAAMDPEVVDPSIAIATPTYVHGETLNQFLSSGVFTINGVVDPNPTVHHSNMVLSDTGAAFLITDQDRDDIFSEHNIIGVWNSYGQLMLLQSNPGGGGNGPSGGGSPSGPPPGGGGSGDNTSVVPEPSAWMLLLSSLLGLAIFRRFRFARR